MTFLNILNIKKFLDSNYIIKKNLNLILKISVIRAALSKYTYFI